jgi:hypothetical protein
VRPGPAGKPGRPRAGATLNQLASRTSDGDVEALGAAHEAEVVAVVELELAHLVRIKVGVR